MYGYHKVIPSLMDYQYSGEVACIKVQDGVELYTDYNFYDSDDPSVLLEWAYEQGYSFVTEPMLDGQDHLAVMQSFFELPRVNLTINDDGCYFIEVDLGVDYGGRQNVVFLVSGLSGLTAPMAQGSGALAGHFTCDDDGSNVRFVDHINLYLSTVIAKQLWGLHYSVLMYPVPATSASVASDLHPQPFVL